MVAEEGREGKGRNEGEEHGRRCSNPWKGVREMGEEEEEPRTPKTEITMRKPDNQGREKGEFSSPMNNQDQACRPSKIYLGLKREATP